MGIKESGLLQTEREFFLLDRFRSGVAYFEKDHPEIVIAKEKIPTGLIEDDEDSPYTTIHDPRRHIILISKNFLSIYSRFGTELKQIIRVDGAIVFEGYVDDFLFFSGLEEAHHGYLYPKVIPLFVDPLSVALCMYDAQKHELAALKYQLQVAVREGKPSCTVKLIAKRIAEAKRVRRELDIF